jgi:hypothetical protein
MQKISELKPGTGIELIATIKEIQPIRKLWRCSNCKAKGSWWFKEKFKSTCPNCHAPFHTDDKFGKEKDKGLYTQDVTSAIIFDETGETYLDLWHEDINRFKAGDKVQVNNAHAYARTSIPKGVNVQKGKFGTIKKI